MTSYLLFVIAVVAAYKVKGYSQVTTSHCLSLAHNLPIVLILLLQGQQSDSLIVVASVLI